MWGGRSIIVSFNSVEKGILLIVGIETSFVKPVEADLVTGRREWMSVEQEKEDVGLWRRVRGVVVG